MIDIHTHLLPGVDDGSRSTGDSLQMLRRFAGEGVRTVACTPHLNASRASAAPFDEHQALRESLQSEAPHEILLLRGWEIMLDQPGVDLTDARLCLGESGALLVEFPHTNLPPNSAAELFRIRLSGRVPVVAHPERYRGCTIGLVEEWRRAGAVIQMDSTAISTSGRVGDLARSLLENSLCDIFASDTHVDDRSLGPVRDWLTASASKEHADLLTDENAKRLLDGREMLRVPPISFEEGMFARIRKAIFKR